MALVAIYNVHALLVKQSMNVVFVFLHQFYIITIYSRLSMLDLPFGIL